MRRNTDAKKAHSNTWHVRDRTVHCTTIYQQRRHARLPIECHFKLKQGDAKRGQGGGMVDGDGMVTVVDGMSNSVDGGSMTVFDGSMAMLVSHGDTQKGGKCDKSLKKSKK